MDFLKAIAGWFQGKKTILGGVVILAGAAAGVWFGKVDPVTGVTLAGAGLSVIGWGDKANRHQAQLLAALEGVAKAGLDLRSGNAAGALAVAESAGNVLLPGVAAEVTPAIGAALHISAPTTPELLDAVTRLTAAQPRLVPVAPAAPGAAK